MKKLILSVVAMASLALAANAETYMLVTTTDGHRDLYDVETVVEVDYSIAEYVATTVSGTLDNYDYVDLGLSVKWATYNVGATKPEETGNYFSWGETKPKKDYSESTYEWCEHKKVVKNTRIPQDFTKYNTDSTYGTVDNKTVLEAADDAATANWGNSWRMPTHDEIVEMVYGCDWKWVDNFNGSGITGNLGTSRANGNTIFLPATGYFDGTELIKVNEGHFMSSTLDESQVTHALTFGFEYKRAPRPNWSLYRILGSCLRAVSDK